MKDYVGIAEALNRDYANLYQATATAHGVTVVIIRQCSIGHAATFIAGCRVVREQNLSVIPVIEDGTVTIR